MNEPGAELLRAIPKLELHVHLEGAIPAPALMELVKRNHVDIAVKDVDALNQRFAFKSFHDFLMLFGELTYALATPADFRDAVLSYAEVAAQDGVIYSELTVSIGTHIHFKDLDPDEILKALHDAAQEAQRRFGIMVRYIFDHVRSFSAERLWETIEICERGRASGVVGLGLGGPEDGFPASRFDSEIRAAREMGLPFVPHAGEASGPESIWDALQYEPRRIGHGVTAIRDPALLRDLQKRRTLIETCLTSNVVLGHVPTLSAHPARTYYDIGIPLQFNTDDATFFRTSMLREYELAASVLGFSLGDLVELNENALDFVLTESPEDRSWLGQRFAEKLRAMRTLGGACEDGGLGSKLPTWPNRRLST